MRQINSMEMIILKKAGLKPWKWMVESENEKYLFIRKTTMKNTRRIIDKKSMSIAD